MQARADEGAAGERDAPVAGQAVIWCGKCGIPYASTLTHCSLCGAPLADERDPFAIAPGVSRAAVQTTPASDPEAAAAAAVIEESLPPMPTLPPTASGGLIGRVRQRQSTMSEDEVDAAAAAIIARARAEEQLVAANPAAREALELSPAYLPDPKLAAALQLRRERDRLWLIAGFVCCVVLIIVALVIGRYTSGGLLGR